MIGERQCTKWEKEQWTISNMVIRKKMKSMRLCGCYGWKEGARLVALNPQLSDALRTTAATHTCSTDWQVMQHQQDTVLDDNNENVHSIENNK